MDVAVPIPMDKKVIAFCLSIVLIATLTLSAARIIDWRWFYGIAIVCALYLWWSKRY